MSIVTVTKTVNVQLQQLIEDYISKQVVTVAASNKRPNVSFASKHLGHANYGRKARRYA
jgi:hypothetical protein